MKKYAMGILLLLVLLAVVLGFVTQSSRHQKEFRSGRAPNPLPDGFWSGSADFPVGSWRGKRFDAKKQSGVNVFGDGNTTKERYAFRMYQAKALWDPGLTVIRIDYNVPENPFWLWPAMDEIVQIAPNRIVGKIHYRLLPNLSIPLGFFRQQQ